MNTLTIRDQDVSDSYIYLLSRLLVLRQQQLDFREGFKWNALVHRNPGRFSGRISMSRIPKRGLPSMRRAV